MTDWKDLQPRFRMMVLRRGHSTVKDIADSLPADRATVYRLMNGETSNPSRALLSAIDRVVSQVRPSDSDDTQG